MKQKKRTLDLILRNAKSSESWMTTSRRMRNWAAKFKISETGLGNNLTLFWYTLVYCWTGMDICQQRIRWDESVSQSNFFGERIEPRSHFKSRLGLIVRVNVVLNRTVVVDSDWRFDNLCGSHLQSQSELSTREWGLIFGVRTCETHEWRKAKETAKWTH